MSRLSLLTWQLHLAMVLSLSKVEQIQVAKFQKSMLIWKHIEEDLVKGSARRGIAVGTWRWWEVVLGAVCEESLAVCDLRVCAARNSFSLRGSTGAWERGKQTHKVHGLRGRQVLPLFWKENAIINPLLHRFCLQTLHYLPFYSDRKWAFRSTEKAPMWASDPYGVISLWRKAATRAKLSFLSDADCMHYL